MSAVVIVCLARADGSPTPEAGQMLSAFDPEACGGRGMAIWTENINDAMTFASSRAAYDCWGTVSFTLPWRPDGEPNRPLTAYTVEIRKAVLP